MIVASYNKKTALIKSEWGDLTIQDAIEVSDLKMPRIEDKFDLFQCQEFVRQCIIILTNIQEKDIDTIDPIQLIHIYWIYLHKFIIDLNAQRPESFIPEMITSFTHEGETFLMPTNLEIGETVILQHGQTVKSFIEASNLLMQFSKMKRDGITVFPYLIASVVKKERDEVFDESEVARRGELFFSLPMSIAWEVFFCLSLLTVKSKIDTLKSIRVKERKGIVKRLTILLGRLRLQKAALLEDLKW